MDSLAAVIDATGISAPSYDDILAALQAQFETIYGTDINLDPDTQDGQLLALIALAISNQNQAVIAAYNSFPPTFAQGAGLSAMVKINGLLRKVPSFSTSIVRITGTVGTVINSGIIQDANQILWDLPASVTIPMAGFIDVTATCTEEGAVAAPAQTFKIFTPTAGWQSAISSAAATLGLPVETDAELRQRQAISTMLPSQTPAQGIQAAVANLTGVDRVAVYENDTNAADSNGLVAHSIAVVVDGGVDADIASAIATKKTLGTGTNGTTTVNVVDPAGFTTVINFYHLTKVEIFVGITVHALPGYTSPTTEAAIQAAIQAFINALAIGESVLLNWLYIPGGLAGDPRQQTFKVTALTIGLSAGTLGGADIAIAFNAAAVISDLTHIAVTVA